MAEETRADFSALDELARACLTAADQLGDHIRAGYGQLSVPGSAFGHDGDDAHRAADGLLHEAQATLHCLVGVLETDAERLYRVAFAYDAADRASAVATGGHARAGRSRDGRSRDGVG